MKINSMCWEQLKWEKWHIYVGNYHAYLSLYLAIYLTATAWCMMHFWLAMHILGSVDELPIFQVFVDIRSCIMCNTCKAASPPEGKVTRVPSASTHSCTVTSNQHLPLVLHQNTGVLASFRGNLFQTLVHSLFQFLWMVQHLTVKMGLHTPEKQVCWHFTRRHLHQTCYVFSPCFSHCYSWSLI